MEKKNDKIKGKETKQWTDIAQSAKIINCSVRALENNNEKAETPHYRIKLTLNAQLEDVTEFVKLLSIEPVKQPKTRKK